MVLRPGGWEDGNGDGGVGEGSREGFIPSLSSFLIVKEVPFLSGRLVKERETP